MNRNRSRRLGARRRTQRRGGFTLMEVMLVLAILVILGSLAFFAFGDMLFAGKTKAAKAQIDAFKLPMNTFLMDEGRWPNNIEELWQPGPKTGRTHMEPVGLDPWGNQYGYEPPQGTEASAKPRIWSNGPNGQQGDGDDITNMTAVQ
jgi:general secretion pathway protein G